MIHVHPEFVVDAQNHKKAVVLSIAEWGKLLNIMEELEDIRAYDKAKSKPSHPIPFDRAIKKIRTRGRR